METISDVLPRFRNITIQAGQPAQPKKAPNCQTCGGSGFVRYELAIDHPLFGKLQSCPDCGSNNTPKVKNEYGLYMRELGLTWANFATLDESLCAAFDAVYTRFIQGYGLVYLWGGYGVAKTHLAKIALAEWLRAGQMGVFDTMLDLIDSINAAYDEKNPGVDLQRRIGWYSSVPMLAIDEMEKTSNSEATKRRLFQLINNRYELAINRAGFTIITGNVAPNALDAALASRLLDDRCKVVHITTQDLRPYASRLER